MSNPATTEGMGVGVPVPVSDPVGVRVGVVVGVLEGVGVGVLESGTKKTVAVKPYPRTLPSVVKRTVSVLDDEDHVPSVEPLADISWGKDVEGPS